MSIFKFKICKLWCLGELYILHMVFKYFSLLYYYCILCEYSLHEYIYQHDKWYHEIYSSRRTKIALDIVLMDCDKNKYCYFLLITNKYYIEIN
jgi:hypothetical protein